MKPYTYLVGWSKHNKYYYGVRYGKKCNPKELWVTYFTSSNYVKEFRKLNGEPDIIQIRKIFDCPEKARLFETRVIQKMNMIHKEEFLNKAVNGTNWTITESAKESVRKSQTIGTRIEKTCEWCGKTGQAAAMGMWHFDYCKKNPNRKKRPIGFAHIKDDWSPKYYELYEDRVVNRMSRQAIADKYNVTLSKVKNELIKHKLTASTLGKRIR